MGVSKLRQSASRCEGERCERAKEEMKMKQGLKLVQTEPNSPFDALWRAFPQLKNATCVGRCGMAWRNSDDSIHSYVIRTFRTLEGKYVRIKSTESGDERSVPRAEEVEVYEDVWKRLGRRALGKPSDQPHGIMFASDQFFELTEDAFELDLIRSA
jgi:hypothetical protein